MIVSTALENLVTAFSRLPGIGRKSAWRLALHILENDTAEVRELAQALTEVKERVGYCSCCFNYSESDRCPICSDPGRDAGCICVVEKPVDIITLEAAGRYHGVYHVLGGVLSPINGVTVGDLHIDELRRRVEGKQPRELILGLGASAEAETTMLYLARVFSGHSLRITRFARGLPAGLDLEYVDQITLGQALQERTRVTSSDTFTEGDT